MPCTLRPGTFTMSTLRTAQWAKHSCEGCFTVREAAWLAQSWGFIHYTLSYHLPPQALNVPLVPISAR